MDPKLSYRQAAVQGASPVRLVVLLYEQVLEDLRRALNAQLCGRIEERTRHLNHALLVIGHLESSLNQERGGQVAVNLSQFYRQVRAGLKEAQFRQSASAIETQIAHLMLVREAWEQVDSASAQSPGLAPSSPQTGAQPKRGWQA